MLAIIDYGIGNIRSVQNAFEHLGASTVLTRQPEEIEKASGVILPGVGAFGEGMRRLDTHALRPALEAAIRSGKPILGICLGFQMLMQSSTEQGFFTGLGYLPLDVIRLPVDARLPHIGWSEVHTPTASLGPSRLMDGLEGEFFYFVHSYAVVQRDEDSILATAAYGGCEFMALVEVGNVFGTQFHPEKSGEAGLELLRNFTTLTK